jgi:hypothetical protein
MASLDVSGLKSNVVVAIVVTDSFNWLWASLASTDWADVQAISWDIIKWVISFNAVSCNSVATGDTETNLGTGFPEKLSVLFTSGLITSNLVGDNIVLLLSFVEVLRDESTGCPVGLVQTS